MQAAIKRHATVQAGHRIEITTPELPEGARVKIIILQEEAPPSVAPAGASDTQGVWDYIQSLTPVQRTPEEWAEVEREFHEERSSWDF